MYVCIRMYVYTYVDNICQIWIVVKRIHIYSHKLKYINKWPFFFKHHITHKYEVTTFFFHLYSSFANYVSLVSHIQHPRVTTHSWCYAYHIFCTIWIFCIYVYAQYPAIYLWMCVCIYQLHLCTYILVRTHPSS